jgi:hypothetical protein
MNKNMVTVGAKIHLETAEQLQKICNVRGISMSEIIREGMATYLAGDNSLAGLAARVEKMEKNTLNLVKTLMAFTEQMNRNFEVAKEMEKVRLQGVVDLIKKRAEEHETNDKERMKLLVEWIERLAGEANRLDGTTGSMKF